jgi:hypothetical protein
VAVSPIPILALGALVEAGVFAIVSVSFRKKLAVGPLFIVIPIVVVTMLRIVDATLLPVVALLGCPGAKCSWSGQGGCEKESGETENPTIHGEISCAIGCWEGWASP